MELRPIRSFLSIGETPHFGRIAEMIHLNQPALSLQIRGLEDEVGQTLRAQPRGWLRPNFCAGELPSPRPFCLPLNQLNGGVDRHLIQSDRSSIWKCSGRQVGQDVARRQFYEKTDA